MCNGDLLGTSSTLASTHMIRDYWPVPLHLISVLLWWIQGFEYAKHTLCQLRAHISSPPCPFSISSLALFLFLCGDCYLSAPISVLLINKFNIKIPPADLFISFRPFSLEKCFSCVLVVLFIYLLKSVAKWRQLLLNFGCILLCFTLDMKRIWYDLSVVHFAFRITHR